MQLKLGVIVVDCDCTYIDVIVTIMFHFIALMKQSAALNYSPWQTLNREQTGL